MYCHAFGVCVTNNNGFWTRRLDLLALRLQLQPIITAPNQWLYTTVSIPYCTTGVFSSDVTNDERRVPAHYIIELLYEFQMIELSWTELTSRRTDYKSPCLTVPLLVCFSVFILCSGDVLTEPLPSNGLFRLFVASGMCVTEPLFSNVHIRHSTIQEDDYLASWLRW
jgi:hypothetical protein